MATEIERRFLVTVPPTDLYCPVAITQGYLSGDPVVRVRIAIDIPSVPGSETAYLCVKGPGSLVRSEFEYEIPYEDGAGLMAMSKATLFKTRYGSEAWPRWEIDQFRGKLDGLWIAELELQSPNEAFECPPWLGREVTGDSSYSNYSLAHRTRYNPGT